jgi:hypothetical protein
VNSPSTQGCGASMSDRGSPPVKNAARKLAANPGRETASGDPKLAELALAGNLFERHVREILKCFPPNHSAAVDRIALSPIECPRCRMLLITGSIRGLPQTFHACRCVMIVHLTPGTSIPRHAGDWAAHLLARAADYAKEEAAHERN